MTPAEAAAAVVAAFLDKALAAALAGVAGYWFGFYKGKKLYHPITWKSGDESFIQWPE